MAIPSSGSLAASQVNVEIDKAERDNFFMDSAGSRELANKPVTGSTIRFSDYRNKIWKFEFTINTSSTSTYDLRPKAVAAGWNQQSRLYVTVKSGKTLEGNPALKIAGSFPNGVYLTIEKGATILGTGGTGGKGGNGAHDSGQGGSAGSAGGSAIRLGETSNQSAFDCYIYCYGTAKGGGGGGGGGAANHRKHHSGTGGCGGGGGAPYGGGGGVGYDTHYSGNKPGTEGEPATATEAGAGGYYGKPRGGGNGGLAGKNGDEGLSGASGKWYSVGYPGAGGAVGAYISGGRYAKIMYGVSGSNLVGSYVY